MFDLRDWIVGLVLNAPPSRLLEHGLLGLPAWGEREVKCSELRLSPAVAAAVRLLVAIENMLGFRRPSGAKPSWTIGTAVHAMMRFDGWLHEVELREDFGEFQLAGHADAIWPGGDVLWDGDVVHVPPVVLEFKYSKRARTDYYPNDVIQVNAYRMLYDKKASVLARAVLCYVTSEGVFPFDVTESSAHTESRIRSWWAEFKDVSNTRLGEVLDLVNTFANENARTWPAQYRQAYYNVLAYVVNMRANPEQSLKQVREHIETVRVAQPLDDGVMEGDEL